MQLDTAVELARHSQNTDFQARLLLEGRTTITSELERLAALIAARRLAEEVRAALPLSEARAANTQTRWDEAAAQVRAEEERLAGVPVAGANYIGAQQQRNALRNVLRQTADERREEHEHAAEHLQALRLLLAWCESAETVWRRAPVLAAVLAQAQA